MQTLLGSRSMSTPIRLRFTLEIDPADAATFAPLLAGLGLQQPRDRERRYGRTMPYVDASGHEWPFRRTRETAARLSIDPIYIGREVQFDADEFDRKVEQRRTRGAAPVLVADSTVERLERLGFEVPPLRAVAGGRK